MAFRDGLTKSTRALNRFEFYFDEPVCGSPLPQKKSHAKDAKMEGGNGATEGSVVTLKRATGVNPWV